MPQSKHEWTIYRYDMETGKFYRESRNHETLITLWRHPGDPDNLIDLPNLVITTNRQKTLLLICVKEN